MRVSLNAEMYEAALQINDLKPHLYFRKYLNAELALSLSPKNYRSHKEACMNKSFNLAFFRNKVVIKELQA